MEHGPLEATDRITVMPGQGCGGRDENDGFQLWIRRYDEYESS